MDKQREQFEAWAISDGWPENSFDVDGKGQYYDPDIRHMCDAWQAALSQDSAAPQDNVPGVSELPVVKTWEERAGEIPFNARVDERAFMRAEIADLRAALRAYGQRAAVAVPQWISVEDRLPEVKAGKEQGFIVACRRGHNGKTYVFQAHYLNELLATNDEEPEVVLTGWHTFGVNPDYEEWWTPTCDHQDAITHWMPLPAAPGAAPSQPQQEAVPAEPSEQDKLDAERIEHLESWLNKCAFSGRKWSIRSFLTSTTVRNQLDESIAKERMNG